MKRILYFTCLCCGILLGFSSCDRTAALSGSVYGFVTDKITGEAVKDAGVELLPLGAKSVTGSDGSFEFLNVSSGTYQLSVTKNGYIDYISSDIVVDGKAGKQHSIQLEKMSSAISIVDDYKNEINIIDFGSDEYVDMLTFNILNSSDETVDWQIQYFSNWLFFEEQGGTLMPHAIHTVLVWIDRDQLSNGENTAIAHVISQDKGTRQITIKAYSQRSETEQPNWEQWQQSTQFYIKHPWASGDWTWKKMEDLGYGSFFCAGYWGGNGANINISANDKGALWYEKDEIGNADMWSIGDRVSFVFDKSTMQLYIYVPE